MQVNPNHRPPKEKIITQPLQDEYYSIYEVSDLLKLHHTTVRKMIKTGEIKAVKVGKQWRIYKDNLQKFISM